DSGACFAALLHDESAGCWQLRPQDPGARVTRGYVEDSLVLRTRWTTSSGTVDVLDFMPPRGEAADVVRVIDGVDGQVAMRTSMSLRFDYGRITPWVRRSPGAGS